MGLAEDIEAEFPPGTTMPSDLRRLCDYFERTGYPISGYLQLRPGGLDAWFDGDKDATTQFAAFGAGGDGSLLAFWLYRGPDASIAPVVHLGSEGQNNTVLASDFREFLHLIGIGYDELGFADLALPPADPQSAERLRAWLSSEFGITPPATGAGLVNQAQARHQNLETWIRGWQTRRYGS